MQWCVHEFYIKHRAHVLMHSSKVGSVLKYYFLAHLAELSTVYSYKGNEHDMYMYLYCIE